MAWFGKRWMEALLSPIRGKRAVSPEAFSLGADFAGETSPSYDLNQAMSAYAGFPWVYAAGLRKARDVSAVPLVVLRKERTGLRRLPGHPMEALLGQPSTRRSGRQYRAQMSLDYNVAGNVYALKIGDRAGLTSLRRLHPGRTLIKPNKDGVSQIIYSGAGLTFHYQPEDVLHGALPSWEDGPEGLFGTGAILPLHNELTTDQRASTRAGEMAKRGRPDAIVSPKGEMTTWSPEVRDQIKRQLNKLLSDGGALVVSSEVELKMPSWTPRDMEFQAVRQLAREAVLAVFGVPPHMVGLPSANYALAERQEIIYFQNVAAEASEMADQIWTPLARELYGPRYCVGCDFSHIPALQLVRNQALERVKIWVELGASAAEAAEYEGLGEGPLQRDAETPETERGLWSPTMLRGGKSK